MIKNRRDLANSLSNNGTVEINNISKKLNRFVELWISQGSIKLINNTLIGNF